MYRKKAQRASRIIRDDGITSFFASSLNFASEILDWQTILKSSIAQTLDIHDRSELASYCGKVSTECKVYPYSKPERHTVESANIHAETPANFEEVTGQYKFTQPYVAEITNGTIHDSGLITTEDGTIILESVGGRIDKLDRKHSLLQLLQHKSNQIFDTSQSANTTYEPETLCPLFIGPVIPENSGPITTDIQIQGQSADGHAGMLLTVLPRLEGFIRYMESQDDDVIPLVGPNPRPILIESLDILGFDTNELKQWHGEPVTAERILIPTIRRQENKINGYFHNLRKHATYKVPSPAGLRWLRDTMTNEVESSDDFPSRVYISRADASTRQVSNREALKTVLDTYNIKPFVLSELSWRDQIRLFSDADLIIGPHGAGLTNITFAHNASVIELLGPKQKPTFFLISTALNLDYEAIPCSTKEKNIRIVPSEVEQAIQRVT